MGGGGSHGSGEVSYHRDILDKFNANYNILSKSIESRYNPPDYVSGDGNIDGSYPTIHIDPAHWYGSMSWSGTGPECGTASDALVAFKALVPLTLFATFLNSVKATTGIGTRTSTLQARFDEMWEQLGDEDGIEAKKAAMVSAFATRLSDRIDSEVVPKLEVSARNVNAVLSSAILMAKVAIWDSYDKEVSDYSAKLDFEVLGRQYSLTETLARLEPSLQTNWLAMLDAATKLAQIHIEHSRIGMASTFSLNDDWWTKYVKSRTIYIEDQIRTTTWGLDIHDYLNKAIAALPGAAVVKSDKGINAAASTVSGAAAGAASGAMIGTATPLGPGWGTAIGAVVGGVAGYLQSQ
jgi:hypothetical protein